MWSPSMKEPLVKMLCHHGPVTAIASDNTGRHMVTCGMDNQLKIWDIRSYKNSLSYHTHRPGGQLAVSATGLIATSLGGLVQVCGGYFQKLFSCGHYYFKNIIFQSKQRETRSLLANFLFPALILWSSTIEFFGAFYSFQFHRSGRIPSPRNKSVPIWPTDWKVVMSRVSSSHPLRMSWVWVIPTGLPVFSYQVLLLYKDSCDSFIKTCVTPL